MDGGAVFPGMGGAPWFDKVPLKTTGWDGALSAYAPDTVARIFGSTLARSGRPQVWTLNHPLPATRASIPTAAGPSGSVDRRRCDKA